MRPLPSTAASTITVLTSSAADARPFRSPLWVLRHMWSLRDSIASLTRREMARLYAGTAFGTLLAVVQSIALMGIYVFVFSYVFEARWSYPGVESGSLRFGVVLFAGLVTFNLFADTVSRACGLMHDNARLITKVVFPVEILPVALCLRVGLVASIGLALVLLAVLLRDGALPATVPLGLLLFVSFGLFSLGTAYVVAAIGTYFRDISHLIVIVLRALLFGTPVFYAVEGLGPRVQTLLLMNPLTWAVESSRLLFALGTYPPLGYTLALLAVGPLCAYLGLLFFMRLRGGFSDVV